jgi:hypothetical protein
MFGKWTKARQTKKVTILRIIQNIWGYPPAAMLLLCSCDRHFRIAYGSMLHVGSICQGDIHNKESHQYSKEDKCKQVWIIWALSKCIIDFTKLTEIIGVSRPLAPTSSTPSAPCTISSLALLARSKSLVVQRPTNGDVDGEIRIFFVGRRDPDLGLPFTGSWLATTCPPWRWRRHGVDGH